MSYVVYEEGTEEAYMVFTGDCMFMGDFGRTDFYGEENLEKMTGLLYDSVFNKILPLGDQVLLLPAHGAGSACGDSMDERPYSSLGYEKATNELLQVESKEEFIDRFAKMRIKPRYFERMEVLNVKGGDFVGDEVVLNVLTVEEVEAIKDDVILVDARTKEGYIGGHIPGSIFLSKDNLTAFLGSMYFPDDKLAFVIDGSMGEMEEIYWYCRRIGFDNMLGYLPEGIEIWQEKGNDIHKLPTVTAREYKEMDKGDDFILLDIRDAEEIEEGDPSENRVNIHLKSLYENLDKLDRNKTIYVLCGSGNRATTAASYLKFEGFNAAVITGGVRMYRNISQE
jgi:hydroxyacylglutathione hydrolase